MSASMLYTRNRSTFHLSLSAVRVVTASARMNASSSVSLNPSDKLVRETTGVRDLANNSVPGASDGISFGGKISRPFPFPKNLACLPIHYQCNRNKSHSTKPNCPVCKRSNPAVVLHSWCLKFVTNTEANLDMPEIDLDAIWTVGVWRRPYAGAPLIALDDRGPAIFSDKDMKILADLASLVDLGGLGKLPREIVCTIWKLSGPGPFWRAVECLKTRATAINASPVSYTPLADVSSWDRDAGLKMISRSKANSVSGDSMSSMDPLPFTFPEQIRITIDRQGIRCIDRGYKDTNYEYRPNTISTDQVFIVINVGAMTAIEQSQLQVEVKVCTESRFGQLG